MRTSPASGDSLQRRLSNLEQARVLTVASHTVVKLQEFREQGVDIRNDGFFEHEPGERPVAEEVAEGILLVAQKEYEEKKLKLYANLLAVIAVDNTIDRPLASHLIRAMEGLLYRQLCYLSLMNQRDRFDLQRGGYDVRSYQFSNGKYVYQINALAQEVYDLYQRSLFMSNTHSGIEFEHMLGSPHMIGLMLFEWAGVIVHGGAA